ncbi:hypothetical protein Tco_1430480 [Tanacetum coccineum]
MKIKESLNVTFDKTPPPSKTSPLVDDDLDEEEANKVTEKKNIENDIEDETLEVGEIVNIKESKNHPLDNVIGNLNQRTLRSQAQNQSNLFCFISTIEPKNVNEALKDESWIIVMQEELNQFITNDVWELVPHPKSRHIHEGRVVDPNFDDMVYIDFIFGMIGFNCLLTISEQIVPRFLLEFYGQFRLDYNSEGQILEFSVPSRGLYQTTPPALDEIKLYVQVEREEPLTRIRHSQTINVAENKILTREITPIMKTWVEIICENVFCLGGNWDHVLACLCHMLYCIATSTKYYLAFFVAKRMELVTKQARLIIPYGRPSTVASSSSAFDHPSSSHHVDEDDDENKEGTSRTSTPSPIRYVNPLSNEIPQVFSNPSENEQTMQNLFTRQTEILNRQVQLRDEHRSGLRSIGKGIKNLWKGKKK